MPCHADAEFSAGKQPNGPCVEHLPTVDEVGQSDGKSAYLVFLVLAVLMVQRLVSVKAMLLTLAACYGGSWILAALAPLWGGAGVWNYGIELFHSFANAAAVVAIGFLVMLLTRKRFGRQGKDHSTDITGR